MRNGQNKRMRGRNRKGQNPLTRVYESNGPDVKIRGTANHVADKYVQLARDAQSSGDPVAAENYYQHAEHYFRLIAAVQEQFRQSQPFYRDGENREGGYDDGDEDASESGAGEPYAPREQQPYQQRGDYQQRDHQQHYPPRERFQRDRDHNRDRGERDRGGEREQPQPYQGRQQPAGENEEAADVDRLPAFLTGGGASPAQPSHQNGANGANGQNFEGGGPDRFPLHRRRRRRHGGGRDAGPASGDAGERSGE